MCAFNPLNNLVLSAQIHPASDGGVVEAPVIILRERLKGTDLIKGRADPCYDDSLDGTSWALAN